MSKLVKFHLAVEEELVELGEGELSENPCFSPPTKLMHFSDTAFGLL